MQNLKSGFLLIMMSCYCFQLHSQTSPESKPTREDSFKYQNVMIIPFDEGMYFSDCDRELARYNKMTPDEVMVAFRYGLSGSVNTSIFWARNTRQLLNDTARTAAYDLARIYKSIGYKMEKPMGLITTQQVTQPESSAPREMLDKLFSRQQTVEKKEEANGQNEDKIGIASTGDRRYLNAKIHDVRMLEYLYRNYKTDLFVFINQFELITDYNHCIDRATQNFERTVKVHYSIYNVQGKQIAGDAAIVHFGSNSNSVYDIIDSNFPKVSAEIISEFPGMKKVRMKEEKLENESGDQL